jgi:hypothetical protein
MDDGLFIWEYLAEGYGLGQDRIPTLHDTVLRADIELGSG